MTTLLSRLFARRRKVAELAVQYEAPHAVEYVAQPVVPAVPPAQVLKRPATPFRPSVLFDETPDDKLDWPAIE